MEFVMFKNKLGSHMVDPALAKIFSKETFLCVVAVFTVVITMQFASGFGKDDILVVLSASCVIFVICYLSYRLVIHYLNGAVKGVDYMTLILVSFAIIICCNAIVYHPPYINQEKVDTVKVVIDDYKKVRQDMLTLTKGRSAGNLRDEEVDDVIFKLDAFLARVAGRRVISKNTYESIGIKDLDAEFMSLKQDIIIRIDSLRVAISEGKNSLFASKHLQNSPADIILSFEKFAEKIEPISASFFKVKLESYINASFFFFLGYFSFCFIYLFAGPFYFELKKEKLAAK